MRTSFAFAAAVLSLLSACRSEAPASEAPRSAETQPAPVVEVTVASVPAGAKVLLQGAELGKTPYQLKLKAPTEITVALDGYEPQTLTVETDATHVVARLVALAAGGEAQAAAAAQPAEEAKPAGPVYDTVTKAKAALRAGKIDRVKYDQIIAQLKARRARRLEELKALYEKGAVDKVEFQRRKAVIDHQYEG